MQRVVAYGIFLAGGVGLFGGIHPPPDALDHWAFQPVREAPIPSVDDSAWPRTGVDHFILSKLQEAGMSPAPMADPRTLIRRMTFGVTGLPPTAEEVARFTKEADDDREAAIDRLIGRLLDSPGYGERWGRHWLDVARYSDTKGYVYAREERRFVHAATYREWVIQAFNEDMPYDRFLLLQLAAEQLVAPDSPDLAAMGFLTGGRRFIGVTHEIIDDRIDVVTRGAMALTVQCARCHDHKYDPIPTADYYSLYGVFHGADERLVPLGNLDDGELIERQRNLKQGMAKRREEAAERLRDRVAEYLKAQLELHKYPEEGFDQILTADDIIPASVRRWRDFLHTNVDEEHPIFAPWAVLSELDGKDFETSSAPALDRLFRAGQVNPLIAASFSPPPASMREVAERYGAVFAQAEENPESPGAAELIEFSRRPTSPTTVPEASIVNSELFFPTTIVDELWKLQGEVDRRLIELGAPAALILADRDPEPNPRIFNRGSPSQLGEAVPRRFLGLIGGPDRQPFSRGSGRLELARAITRADNPLTARVMVNRIWQHHFGEGLVRTPSDFGLRAEPPSHPGLLDWLAHRFVEEGWSVKAIQRLILSSAVYQQRSERDGRSRTFDPDNRLLSHFPMRRLDFEQLRDAMLFVSGDLERGGHGPPLPLLDVENKRRTVYAFVDRQFLPGTFRTFDFANPDIHVAVRHETTVPQQALFFLNNRFAADRARSLAAGLGEETDEARVQSLHRSIYQREASSEEVRAALAFLASAERNTPPPPPRPVKTQWLYGSGEYDPEKGRLKSFTPLPHFTGAAWQGDASWPGGETGWAQLTAEGGHPGDTRAHACVRRWVAPHAMTVNIAGLLKHEPEAGDGIRAFISSSRQGELKAAALHHEETMMSVTAIELEEGDTIDFIVDIGDVLNSDQFQWQPTIVAGDEAWSAAEEFSGPALVPDYLSAWEQYAHVLLLSNEFAFLD